ncbi:MAG: sulfatase-like hydrolase/transferase [Bacteroidales bacterium]|nr:sulfatase-like hydrolase/transferase [Bacteroidales bacterium]
MAQLSQQNFRKIVMFICIGVMITGMSTNAASNTFGKKPTNIVLICTDNQSPWSLGCYGNKEILTPNIDRLAQEGMLFKHSYSSNPVCSPARATLLTGLIPSQHGVHNYLIPSQKEHGVPDYLTKGIEIGPDAYNTIEEFQSLPEILSESGYVCGLSGKWHLGDNLNPHEGFSYWVTSPGGHTTTYYNADVIENGQIRTEPMYLTDFWTDRGIRFIEQNKDQPFFLLLTYNGPYGLHGFLDTPAKNRHGQYYETQQMNSFPREETHPWLVTNRESVNNIAAMRRYAAEVSGVDDGVGRIMDALKRLKLDENTLIIYTSDQGLCGGHHGMWGMADHSRPLHTYDETIHTPMIWRHPNVIPEGKRQELMVSNYDVLPTILNYLGLENKVIPGNPKLPGRDYSAVLQGQQIKWENIVYYEFDNTRMIRTSDWKYTERFPQGACIDELYDLKNDPSEKKNIVNVEEHSEIKNHLQKKLHAFFDEYANPKYDLWKNGRSKSGTLIFKK